VASLFETSDERRASVDAYMKSQFASRRQATGKVVALIRRLLADGNR